jgi:ribosomal protein S18 acetylase RimI-like enzyme
VERRIPERVELLTRDQLDRAAITLERAFFDDPLFTWVFPDSVRRSCSLRRLNRVPLEFGLRYGRVTQLHEAKAVAIWGTPGREVTPGAMIRSGLLSAAFQIGIEPFLRFAGANDTIGKAHKKCMPEPHAYLLVVGVDPELQGQGSGTMLVREGLKEFDRSGCPCYLETSQPRNLPFYKREGFSVVESVSLGKGGPTGWAMRRNPGATGWGAKPDTG